MPVVGSLTPKKKIVDDMSDARSASSEKEVSSDYSLNNACVEGSYIMYLKRAGL